MFLLKRTLLHCSPSSLDVITNYECTVLSSENDFSVIASFGLYFETGHEKDLSSFMLGLYLLRITYFSI